MTNDEKIRRAGRAAEIMQDELVVEALTTMRAFVADGFRDSKLGDRDEREALYFLNVGIESFASHFREVIETGRVAKADAERAQQEAASS